MHDRRTLAPLNETEELEVSPCIRTIERLGAGVPYLFGCAFTDLYMLHFDSSRYTERIPQVVKAVSRILYLVNKGDRSFSLEMADTLSDSTMALLKKVRRDETSHHLVEMLNRLQELVKA